MSRTEKMRLEEAQQHLLQGREGLLEALDRVRGERGGYRGGVREKIIGAMESTDDALNTLLQGAAREGARLR